MFKNYVFCYIILIKLNKIFKIIFQNFFCWPLSFSSLTKICKIVTFWGKMTKGITIIKMKKQISNLEFSVGANSRLPIIHRLLQITVETGGYLNSSCLPQIISFSGVISDFLTLFFPESSSFKNLMDQCYSSGK